MSFEHQSLGCSFPRASAFCGMSAIDALRTIPPHLRCPSEAEPRRRNIALVNWPAAPRTRRAGAAVARKGSRSGRDVSRRKETGRGGPAGGRCRSLAGSPSQETSHARTTRRCRDSQAPRARDGEGAADHARSVPRPSPRRHALPRDYGANRGCPCNMWIGT
jgi:hypothetical protein